MKRCPKCSTEKPLADFAKKRGTKDGLQCWCRACSAAGRKAWVDADPERARVKAGQWAKDNPEANRTRVKAWRAENPEYVRQRDAAYRQENAVRFAERSKARREANPEAIRARRAAYTAANLDQIRERRREWKRANPALVLADVSFRKHRKRRATPPWLTREQRRQIASFYKSAEALGMLTGERHEVDHVVPLNGETVCGLHVPWNLQVLTAEANRAKSNRLTGLDY